MRKQLSIFGFAIPPCKHCGGKGRWVDGGKKDAWLPSQLYKLSCKICTFETNSMVESCKDTVLQAWISGFPASIYDSDLKRSLTMVEYYELWPEQIPKKKNVGCCHV